MGPIITVFVDINDEAGLKEMTRRKRFGKFAGSSFVKDDDGKIVGIKYQYEPGMLPMGCYFDLR